MITLEGVEPQKEKPYQRSRFFSFAIVAVPIGFVIFMLWGLVAGYIASKPATPTDIASAISKCDVRKDIQSYFDYPEGMRTQAKPLSKLKLSDMVETCISNKKETLSQAVIDEKAAAVVATQSNAIKAQVK